MSGPESTEVVDLTGSSPVQPRPRQHSGAPVSDLILPGQNGNADSAAPNEIELVDSGSSGDSGVIDVDALPDRPFSSSLQPNVRDSWPMTENGASINGGRDNLDVRPRAARQQSRALRRPVSVGGGIYRAGPQRHSTRPDSQHFTRAGSSWSAPRRYPLPGNRVGRSLSSFLFGFPNQFRQLVASIGSYDGNRYYDNEQGAFDSFLGNSTFAPPEPDLDYGLFSSSIFGNQASEAEQVAQREAEYKAPSPPPDGYTRAIKTGQRLVCPGCDDELGASKDPVKKSVWASRCGHVYCGTCAARQRELKSRGRNVGRCVVPGCQKVLGNGKHHLWEVFI